MNLKTIIKLALTTTITMNFALANTSSELQGQVNDMESFVDNMLAGIQQRQISPQDMNQDYVNARENLLNKMQQATNNYKACFATVSNTIQDRLTTIEQEIANLERYIITNSSRDFNQLLEQLKERRLEIIEQINSSQSEAYQVCLKKLIGLESLDGEDSHIKLLIGYRFSKQTRLRRFLNLIPFGFMATAAAWKGQSVRYVDFLGESVSCGGHDYTFDCGRFRPRLRRYMPEFAQRYAEEMFAGCQSDVCKVLLKNDYYQWIQATLELNQDLTIGDGIVLNKLDLPKKRKHLRLIREALNNAIGLE